MNSKLKFKYAPASEKAHNWQDDAACLPYDPELFFPIGEGKPDRDQINKARKICRDCPVIMECLQEALLQTAQYGIYAGLTASERRQFKQKGTLTAYVLHQTINEKLRPR